MDSTTPAQDRICEGIGLCHSWTEQQRNIATFLELRSVRSDVVPRLLLAQFDNDAITVYQAYKPSIGLQAAQTGNFTNSEFSFSRMTWIKPNFSWMMHHSGWASKYNQETILAIKLKRSYFDELLAQAVPTSWDDASYGSAKEWHKALRNADVLVQWDPDHHLVSSAKLPYRVLQLGVRGAALHGFNGSEIISITDITSQVRDIRHELFTPAVGSANRHDAKTPLERRYPVSKAIQKVQRIS